jgi:D-glycero-D-manno-heptose 1,7-bisphosphate phosphatase
VIVRRAAFVDRDGVINELAADPRSGQPESPLRVDQVALIPGAAAGLRTLGTAGFLLVGVTNQPAAAKGTVSRAAIEAVQTRVLELLAREDVKFDAFRICMHHPDGLVDDLSGPCECRKPAPGMLLDAAAELAVDLGESWMIGDTDADILAGQAAGCRTVLIAHARSAHKRRGTVDADGVVGSLTEASEFITGAFTHPSRDTMN